MAEHSVHGRRSVDDLTEHRATYEGFLRGSIAIVLMTFFTMVALVSFRFGHSFSSFLGFAGLLVGTIAVLIDLKAGSRWYLSLGVLLVFALITAVNVSS